ncbi:MAG: hypothetical protein ACTSXJ_04230 [Candidatus Baldrarchaeia archaeon]
MSRNERTATRINNIIIYGLQKALWEALGEGAIAATALIGKELLDILENELGLKVSGEDPQTMLNNLSKLLVDEWKIAESVEMTQEGDSRVIVKIKGCMSLPVEEQLTSAGIKPFVCPFTNIATAAMRKLLGAKTRVTSLEVSGDTCKIVFEIYKE